MRRTTMPAIAGFLAFLAGAIPTPGHAADGDGNFALRGFGAETCKAALENLKQDKAATATALAWLLGYSTAFNRMQTDTFDVSPLTDPASIFRMVTGICERTPELRVETVAFDVLRTLAAARVTTSSPIVETGSDGGTAQVRWETLVRMQGRLIELGHLTGKPDGAYGPRTESALRSFQKDQQLPVTGIADPATVVRMLVELPGKGNK